MATGDFPPPGLAEDAYKRLLEATPTEWPPMRPRSDTKELDSLRGTIDSLTKRLKEASAETKAANLALERFKEAFDGRSGSLVELATQAVHDSEVLGTNSRRISIHIDVHNETLNDRPEILEMVRQIRETGMIALIAPKRVAPGTPMKHDQPKGELAGSW
jgi:hypothetical protein